jgi:hypothetical protein
MTDAAQYVTDNENTSVTTLLCIILQENRKKLSPKEKNEMEIAPETVAECKKLAEELVMDIKNYAKKSTNKSNRMCFSPRAMRMALSMYVDSPKGYKAFQKTSLLPYPSISTLKKIKSKMTPEEGTFPMIYAWFRDEFMNSSTDSVFGHIMCDEMKLRSDFYWNPMNRKCVGIVVNGDNDRISLAEEVAKLYKDGNKEEDSSYSISLSVNQFRFRSVDNRTHTGEFFFNNGSLSGDDLLKQTKQVILGYEMAGAQILGLGLDGGGNNARLLKLLRAKESAEDIAALRTEISELEQDMLAAQNTEESTKLRAKAVGEQVGREKNVMKKR